ncbi:MAG: Na+/proline symporter [Desulfovibrionaceae bacterium]|nr:MAG: Na+/proline symporter [Desulfovibrionaceae bacterium]
MDIWDYAVLLAYFGILVGIGWRASRRQKDMTQYFVGGRRTGTLAIMTLWMASWVGGATILGTAEQAYEMGLRSLLYPCAIAFGCVLFALTFTGKIKEAGDAHGHITYPDFIEKHYGSRCRVVSTVTAFCANIGYTSSQLLATALIMNQLTGWSLGLSFVVSTAVTVLYTAAGGFLAMDETCRFQAALIFIGTGLVGMPLTLWAVGEAGHAAAELPAGFTSFGGVSGWSLVGMFLSVIMTFYTSSDSYIRCFSAKSRRAATVGTMLAALLIVSIGVSVCVMGLGARLLFPELGDGANAFITIIMRLFPSGVKGLMLVVLLAAIMSTACSCILAASANITRDIYQRFINPGAPDRRVVGLSVAGSVLVGAVSALLAWYVRDIIGLLFMAFTINSASLFLPTLGAYFWRRGTERAAFWSIALSLATVLVWYAGRECLPGAALFDVDPVWPGLALSAALFFSLSLRGGKDGGRR